MLSKIFLNRNPIGSDNKDIEGYYLGIFWNQFEKINLDVSIIERDRHFMIVDNKIKKLYKNSYYDEIFDEECNNRNIQTMKIKFPDLIYDNEEILIFVSPHKYYFDESFSKSKKFVLDPLNCRFKTIDRKKTFSAFKSGDIILKRDDKWDVVSRLKSKKSNLNEIDVYTISQFIQKNLKNWKFGKDTDNETCKICINTCKQSRYYDMCFCMKFKPIKKGK